MTATNDPRPVSGPQSSTFGDHTDVPASPPADEASKFDSEPSQEDSDSISLPPPQRRSGPMTEDQLRGVVRQLDLLLAAVILLLTLFLSSFALRNSDFWMHLATGRGLTQGKFSFGEDPFSYTSTKPWVNHNWLYDVATYAAYQAAGGPAIVLLKALLVVLLAASMISIHRAGRSLWIPAVCTGVAVLAMSPRLLVQPATVSLVLLGLTLWLLSRGERMSGTSQQGELSPERPKSPLWHLWLLPPLFALWVNIDGWFFLGPLTVALYLLGEGLQSLGTARGATTGSSPRERLVLLLVLIVGVGACLLNPYGARAFKAPAELTAIELIDNLTADPYFHHLFDSAWHEGNFQLSRGLGSLGAMYVVLAILGIVSFAVNLGGWRWWRALVWLAFFALASYYARALAFFAVTAGPIMALNFQDFAARRADHPLGDESLWRYWLVGGRVASVLVAVLLVLLAWPGWLFGPLAETRRVAWQVDVDSSLQRMAEKIHEWRQQNILTDKDLGFHIRPEITNYCAWFCPDKIEKGFFDYRLDLFSPETADEYIHLRRNLKPRQQTASEKQDSSGAAKDPLRGPKIFRERGINHVVMYEGDPLQMLPEFAMLFTDRTKQWTLADLQGQAAIFAWRDPQGKNDSPFHRLRFDPDPLAFAAQDVDPPQPGLPTVKSWTENYAFPPPHRPSGINDALMDLFYFDLSAPLWRYEQISRWWLAASSVAVVGSGTAEGTSAGLSAVTRLALCMDEKAPQKMAAEGSQGPLAPALLAARAARRGAAADSEAASAYSTMAQAYLALHSRTEEAALAAPLRQLQLVRQCQILAAFRNTLLLQPDQGAVHLQLAQMFTKIRFPEAGSWPPYLSLASEHLEKAVQCMRDAGPSGAQDPTRFRAELDLMEKQLADLNREVADRNNKYITDTAMAKHPLEKVGKALQLGLPDKALEVLSNSSFAEIGPQGFRLLLDLMLQLGRLEEAKPVITEELRNFGPGVYEWYAFLLSAGMGDYKQADSHLAALIEGVEHRDLVNSPQRGLPFSSLYQPSEKKPLGLQGSVAYLVGQLVLRQLPHSEPISGLLLRRFTVVEMEWTMRQDLFARIQERANFLALRGALALEDGNSAAAARWFEEAIGPIGVGRGPCIEFNGLPLAASYLSKIRAQHAGKNLHGSSDAVVPEAKP